VRYRCERGLPVCGSIRKAEQKHAAVVQEEWRVPKIRKFLPEGQDVKIRLRFCFCPELVEYPRFLRNLGTTQGVGLEIVGLLNLLVNG
jgi:hypothetical protein